MKKAATLALAALLLSACWGVPDEAVGSDQEGHYVWYYIEGPNGEHCLVMHTGTGQTQSDAMSCDRVVWPD